MTRIDRRTRAALFLALLGTAAGCFGGNGSDGASDGGCAQAASGDDDDDDGSEPDDDRDHEDDPAATIEESDLYRLDENRLYVYGYSRGLTVLDVTDAAAPATLGQLALAGPAGELYARSGEVTLLLETPGETCSLRFGPDDTWTSSELVTIDAVAPEAAAVLARVCLSGTLVASRLLGNRLYAVTSEEGYGETRSWVMAIDLTDPVEPALEALLSLEGSAREIHVSADHSLYVSQAVWNENYTQNTRVLRIDLESGEQILTQRGEILLTGAPAGRFHMDAAGGYFRLVTFDEYEWTSVLHVVNFSDPDAPVLAGALAIGNGERLYATRFDGDRAYVVTFLQTDPLWVVDLSDPQAPSLLGELVVPGWSNFIFPRGNRLLTVGRGDGGSGVALALFDVTDPTAPSTLQQITFGDWNSSSEADFDFRGLGIVEAGAVSAPALIALPVSSSMWDSATGDYSCSNTLHLVTLDGDALTTSATIARPARVRRSFPLGGRLYSLSDLALSAIDASDPWMPQILAEVATGDETLLTEQCPYPMSGGFGGWEGDDWGSMDCGGCSVSGTRARPSSAAASLALVVAGLVVLRTRRKV